MRKKLFIIAIVVVVLGLGIFVFASKTKKVKAPLSASTANTHTVAYGDIESKIDITGEVQPETVVSIKSRVSGKIVRFYVKENDYVSNGQIIADIEPDYNQANTLFNTKASLQMAELNLEKARKDHNDSLTLLENAFISQSDFDLTFNALKNAEIQFEQASRQYEMIRDLDTAGTVTHVLATASGTVIERAVNEGEMVSSSINSFGEGTIVMKIADLNRMIVKSNINEVDIAKFRLGQKAVIKLDALPYEEFNGEIVKIAPMAITENNAKVFPVEISINATGKQVMPGMTAAVSIKGDSRQNVILVPIGAVFSDDQNNDIVYLVTPAKAGEEANTAAPQSSPKIVKLGANDFQMVEVIEGLKEGDTVSLEEPDQTGSVMFY